MCVMCKGEVQKNEWYFPLNGEGGWGAVYFLFNFCLFLYLLNGLKRPEIFFQKCSKGSKTKRKGLNKNKKISIHFIFLLITSRKVSF